MAQTSGLPGGASSLSETYKDWTVACFQQGTTKHCLLSQVQQQQNGQRVLAIELNAPTGNTISGTLVLPFGLALEPGVTFQIDEKPAMQPIRFRTCLPAGCLVNVTFDAATLVALRAGATLKIKTTADGGAAMPFSISLQGFGPALVPELWEPTLQAIGDNIGSAGGSLLVYEATRPAGFAACGQMKEIVADFAAADRWRGNHRIEYFRWNPFSGFVTAGAYFTKEFLEQETGFENRAKAGFGDQIGTMIPMPAGELVVVVVAFDRWGADGPYADDATTRLNAFYPHLVRFGMIAARLGLERAQTTVSTLEALGIPAAMLTRTGGVLASNGLLETVSDTLLPIAFGGLAIASAPANRLFQAAIAHALVSMDAFVRSIPVPAHDDQPALVVHILPLFRSARDVLFGADILVVVTSMRSDNLVPAAPILMGLFDLTPSEARLATSLASGKSLRDTAVEMEISFGSARTYLAHVFAKTGTSQQSQLVSLLKSSQPVSTPQQRRR